MSVSDHLFVPPHHHNHFLDYYQDFPTTNTTTTATSHYQQPNPLPPVSLLTHNLPRQHHHNHQSSNPVNNHHHQTTTGTTTTNPAFTMNTLSTDEMERFQKLSNEFEADVQGPLVSTKESTQAIAMDYANADPTLATKTSTLAITHPTSRIMKGDGNCGWRAVAFGYFENLFALRDLVLVQNELVRIKSLSSLLEQVGHEEYLYEIFVDATEQVFTQLIQAIQDGVRDDSFLVNAFNVEYSSNAILTHFRLLTSAWMKLNPQRYQAFIGVPLDQYCATRVETVKSEIDEVGLQALVDGVIERSGFAVEILYLDRSQGDAVTPHLLTPSQASIETIRLLYRPGHYDLLYRPEPTVNMEPVVNYQYAMTSNYSPWDQGALSFDVNASLMSIPNLMMDPTFAMAPAPMSPAPPISPPQAAAAAAPPSPYRVSSPQEVYQPPMPSPPPPPTSISSPPAPHQMSGLPPSLNSLPGRSSEGPQIRLNPLVMKPNLSHSLPVTTPFKNSPYNQAHFQNQDFEPIHWAPHESRR